MHRADDSELWPLLLPGVVACAIGWRRGEGLASDEPALLVFARERRDVPALPRVTRIGGARRAVEVVEAAPPGVRMAEEPDGDPEYSRRVRPIKAGYSIGLRRRVGTLGLVVAERGHGRGKPLLLSSAHVFNHLPDGRLYRLYQPGGRDGGRAIATPVATAYRYTRLHPTRANATEAAVATPVDPDAVDAEHPLGSVSGTCSELSLGRRLVKIGRTTGHVVGRVVATGWSGYVDFRGRPYLFTGQVQIEGVDGQPVCLDGDSGSVWLTPDGRAAALAFAGSDDGARSICTPIDRVFSRLGVGLAADG